MTESQTQFLIEYFDNKFDSLIEAFQVMVSILARQKDVEKINQKLDTLRKVSRATNNELHEVGSDVKDVKKDTKIIKHDYKTVEGRLAALESMSV